MIGRRDVIRGVGHLLVVGALVLVTACGAPEPKQPSDEPPLLGWLLQSGDGGCPAADEVRGTAEGLVASGLAAAGYRTVFVVCARGGPPIPEADRAALEADGIAVSVIDRTDDRVSHALEARWSAAHLQRAITEAVVAAEPLIVAGDSRAAASPPVTVLANREVVEVAVDSRRIPGGPVGDTGAVAARAIGEKGIVVSLVNTSAVPRRIAFAIADLNLSGDDSVPATDLWTGQRQTSVDGELGANLPPGGSALLAIGR